jgi:acyl-CoA synthetase (NDP forming)
MKKSDYSTLTRIFNPENIAIIGVSSEGFGFGRGILLSLLSIGYSGGLFPVNPRGGTISGLKIFESVQSIPLPIDLAIIAVPAPLVPDAVISCMQKGAAGVEILSAGFSETGTPEGSDLEKQLAEIAARGVRIIGPNCFGCYNPRSGLTMLPGPDLSREPGPVGFISQSGGMAIDLAHIGAWRGIRFSTMVSFGNGVDLRETELLEYFDHDPETKMIGVYLEGLKSGRSFFEVLKSVSMRKPVIICKGGLSESGSRAAMSHTASIAGKNEIWKSVFRQTNAVQAVDLADLCNYSLAFSTLPEKLYKGISVIGGGGAIGVSAADMTSSYGMSMPEFDKDIRDAILELLPRPGSSARNPVDVANPFVSPEVLKKVLLLSARCATVDIQIVVLLLYHYKSIAKQLAGKSISEITPTKAYADAFSEASIASGKPVVVVLPDYKQEPESLDVAETIRDARKRFTAAGIPVYDDIHVAIRSVYAVSNYYRRRAFRYHAE